MGKSCILLDPVTIKGKQLEQPGFRTGPEFHYWHDIPVSPEGSPKLWEKRKSGLAKVRTLSLMYRTDIIQL